MTILDVALVILVIVLAITVLIIVLNQRHGNRVNMTQIDQRLDSLNRQLGQVTNQSSTYQETVNAVHQALGGVTQLSSRILEISQDMRQLQDVLAAPKLRGGLGELLLEDLLQQVLPKGTYQMQYTFLTGQRVDAIIQLANGTVPVDAKFPLESFRRLRELQEDPRSLRRQFRSDIKRHIDDIAQNYIIPGETLDFALMYIPAENIYYEIMLQDPKEEGLLDYAWAKRVIPTSPNSFYTYLQVITLGFKGLKVEQNARAILDSLTRLQGEFGKFAEDYRLIGTHLGHAQDKYNQALPKLDSLQRSLPPQGDYGTLLNNQEQI